MRISRTIARADKGRLLQGVQVSALVEERVDHEGDNACGDLPKRKMGTIGNRPQATGLNELSCQGRCVDLDLIRTALFSYNRS